MSGFWQGYNIGALNHTGSGSIDDPVQLDAVVVATTLKVADPIVSSIGGLGTGMQQMGGSFRLRNGSYNGNTLSFKHYNSGWGGGSRAQITTYNALGNVSNVALVFFLNKIA